MVVQSLLKQGDKPLFSIIIPCFKTSPQTLSRAVGSALSQSYDNFELIVVDDDGLGEYRRAIETYGQEVTSSDSRAVFLFHEVNKGANAARNTGVEAANGDWLAFLDADDCWDKCYLENVAAKIALGSFSLVSTPIRIDTGKRIREVPFEHEDGYVFYEEINGDIFSPSSGICANKEVLLEAGGFDETLPARQDYDMWLRICEHHQVAFCNRIAVTVYRDGHESISSGYERHLNGTLAVIEKIKANDAIEEGYKKDAVDSQYKYLAEFLARKGEGRLARQYLHMVQGHVGIALLAICLFPGLFNAARRVGSPLLHKIRGDIK